MSDFSSDYCTDHLLYLIIEWRSQYEKSSANDFSNVVKYDYYSVMHYPLNAPGTNKPAFELLDPSINPAGLGQRQGATDLDISKIKKLYGCPDTVLTG